MTTATFQAIGTTIGTAIGGPIGGAIGGWIGAAAGAYVDGIIISSLLAPDPPHLADLRVQVSTYGRPLPIAFGEKNRVAGNVIWSTGLVETPAGGKGAPEPEHYTYSTSVAVAVAEGVCERVTRIWANGKAIYDEAMSGDPLPATDTDFGYFVNGNAGYSTAFETLRFYPGSSVQEPDPTIQAVEGIDNTQRYKKTCYVVLQGLQLADFGNRLPNLEFEILAVTGESVGEAVRRIVVRCGLAPNTVSTALLDQQLRGYMIGNKANGIGALQPLAMAYSFDLCEVWGSLRCQPRGGGPAGTIRYDQMGARQAMTTREEPIRWPRVPETQLPQMATITFPNPERDMQEDTQRATRGTGSSDAKVANEIAVSLTSDEGRALSDKLLWEAVSARQMAAASVSDRLMSIEPGRAYMLQGKTGLERVKLVGRTRGANGVHKIELRQDRREIYHSTAPGAVAPVPENQPRIPGETQWQPLDIPILREADDDSGFYWGTNGPKEGWRGADLWRSAGGGYTHVAQLATETVFGAMDAILADGPSHIWDDTNTIQVTLDGEGETLESATELEVYNGANLAWIGDPDTGQLGELIQFRDAVLTTPPRTYTLSGLLRGRFGTEYATGLHSAAERLVLISATEVGMGRADFGAGDWNRNRAYRTPTLGHKLAEATDQNFTNEGEGKRPYSVVDIESARDGSNNLTLGWTRRSRIPAPGLGYGPTPLGEAVEAYEVDIIVAAVVKRTLSSATPTVAYTAAQQTADGITPGNPVSGIIYQLSDIRGRGHGAAFTV